MLRSRYPDPFQVAVPAVIAATQKPALYSGCKALRRSTFFQYPHILGFRFNDLASRPQLLYYNGRTDNYSC